MSIEPLDLEAGLRLSPARETGAAGAAGAPLVTRRFVRSVCERLAAGKPVRRRLPTWGRIHVDRQLPFLCVYRRRSDDEDGATGSLLVGEAAYLLASGERALHEGLASLVEHAIDTLLPNFGAFLLLEVWTSGAGRTEAEGTPTAPRFRIVRSRRPEIGSTVDVLERALGRIRLQRRSAEVEVVEGARITAPGLRPLLGARVAAEPRVHSLGLEVPEAYRDAATGQPLPVIQRRLHRGLSRALKRACFEFTRSQTTQRPLHFHALGRRSMVKAVWKVDRELAELANAFDLLLLATPTNTEAAWHAFRRKGFARAPVFTYRPLPVEPALLKRRLWKIPVERIEDPGLEDLFRKQQIDLDRRIGMLSDRLTPRFATGSVLVFGRPDPALLGLARQVLEQVPPRTRDEASGRSLGAAEFAARAEQEIALYRAGYPELASRVELRDDYAGLVVSRGNLLVGAETQVPLKRVKALLSHEIGTHVVTYANGRSQPFHQLYVGLPDYDELQEGLAVLAEFLVGGLSRERLRLLAARVVAVQHMLDGASFQEVFRELDDEHCFAQRTAFGIAMRVFRGGGLAKDMVYLRGLDRLLAYLGGGGRIEPLLLGKLGVDHVGLVEELRWRKVLRQAPLRPRYLDDPDARERLERVRQGVSVLDLVEGGER